MAFGWLAAIGNALAKGATTAGKFAGKGIKTLGRGLDLDEEMALTPGFNPGAPVPALRRPGYRPGYSDLLDRRTGMEPTNDMKLDIPFVNRSPELPIMPNVEPPRPDPWTGAILSSGPPKVSPEPGRRAAAEAAMMRVPAEIAPPVRREDVPIPQLPGRSGEARPYNPIDAAEYDYVMSQPNSSNVKGLGSRLKSGLKPALLGLLQGIQANPNAPLASGLGGAAAGFAGGAIDPTSGRQYEFALTRRPEIEAAMKREREGQGLEGTRRKQALDIEGAQADIDYRRAQTEATRAGMKDSELERKIRQATLEKIEAEAEAKRTGQPKLTDYVTEDGRVVTGWVYPDGRVAPLGGSAKAAISGQTNKTKEKVAGMRDQNRLTVEQMRQAGARERTQMQQQGATGRAQMRQSGKTAATASRGAYPKAAADAYIQMRVAEGATAEQARKEIEAAGYKTQN